MSQVSDLQLHQQQRVREYYAHCERDYQRIWDLDRSAAMHLGFWDESVRDLPGALRRQDDWLVQHARITAEDRVLDAGCGAGGSAVHLAATVGCDVTGITLIDWQIRRAQALAEKYSVGDRTRFTQADYTATGFEAGSFDVVWAVESVCHAADQSEFARESHRLLRPGGRLVVADAFAGRAPGSHREQRILRKSLEGFALPALHTTARFDELLTDAGFSDVQCVDVTRRVLPSSRRLYWWSYPAWVVNKIRKHRGPIQMGNCMAARNQYRTLVKGLCVYSVFTATR